MEKGMMGAGKCDLSRQCFETYCIPFLGKNVD